MLLYVLAIDQDVVMDCDTPLHPPEGLDDLVVEYPCAVDWTKE